MCRHVLNTGAALICVCGIGVALSLETSPPAHAQSKGKTSKKSKSPKNIKTLEVRSKKLQEDFARNSINLAREFEAAGELDKAKRVYSALTRMNPQSKEFRDRLNQVNDAILSANAYTVEIDTSSGWGSPLAQVSRGKSFRVQAAGTYRLQANLPVGAAGFSVGDPVKSSLAENVRCGALMGLIVNKGKPGKPFPVGADREINPRSDGLLYLRVNVPEGSKCTGKLTVRLGGNLERN